MGRKAADYDNESDKEFTFALNPSKKDRPTVKITINGVLGLADADSCSSVNVMDIQQYTKIAQKASEQMPLNPADTPLYAYAQSTPIPLAGRFHAKICSVTTGRSVDAEFLVIDQQANSRPLLSFETAVQLGVMQVTQKLTTPNVTQKLTTLNLCKEAAIQIFPEVFNGIGLHKTIQAKLIVDMSVTPIAQKPRKIPYNLTRLAQKEEDRLLEAGIIEKVPDDIATTWCTNPVIVPKPYKPGHIRYCSNMRVPNTAIKRPITEALTVDDIKVMMSGSTVFSMLDMNEAYHELELYPESRHLTTFYGTQGRLRYKRLNFGTILAQDIFDKAVDDTIQGLQGVVHIRDDFIIHGCSQEQHDERLIAFLNRMKESGLTLCPKKCKIAVPSVEFFGVVPSVEFFGVVFEKKGTSPAPSKVEALRNVSRPKDVGEMRSLSGMAQYSAQYIPNFSSITAPLRNLTKSSVKWKWGQEEEEAFNKIKHSLSEDSVLGYYELNQPTKLMVDAGPEGLGLILAQKKSHGWQAVVCHSRSLTPAERNYSQMERGTSYTLGFRATLRIPNWRQIHHHHRSSTLITNVQQSSEPTPTGNRKVATVHATI